MEITFSDLINDNTFCFINDGTCFINNTYCFINDDAYCFIIYNTICFMYDNRYCFMICVNEKKKITDILYDDIIYLNILNLDFIVLCCFLLVFHVKQSRFIQASLFKIQGLFKDF